MTCDNDDWQESPDQAVLFAAEITAARAVLGACLPMANVLDALARCSGNTERTINALLDGDADPARFFYECGSCCRPVVRLSSFCVGLRRHCGLQDVIVAHRILVVLPMVVLYSVRAHGVEKKGRRKAAISSVSAGMFNELAIYYY
ncbi:hypothetical protein ACQ4PT_016869 [Festuca glaucescens]